MPRGDRKIVILHGSLSGIYKYDSKKPHEKIWSVIHILLTALFILCGAEYGQSHENDHEKSQSTAN